MIIDPKLIKIAKNKVPKLDIVVNLPDSTIV